MRKKIEIEETVPGKISGNVHVLDADTFCNNNKDCLPETCITSIKNLKNGKTVKVELPNYPKLTIKLYGE